MLQAVEQRLNCPAVGIEPDDRLRRHGRRQQQPVLGPTPLDAQRDPDGADPQTAEEAGPEPEAAEADRYIVVDAEALLDGRVSLSRSNRMPYLAGRPRPEEERRVETRLADDGDATRHGPEDEARAPEPRVDEKDVGAKLVEHGANEDLGQLAAVKSDSREARGRLRRPGGPMTVESETRFCARTSVRFPGMVEPACGAWCFLRTAQEQCVVQRHDAAVLLHEAIAHDAAECDVEPGEAVSLDHAEVGAPSPPGSDRRDSLCHVAREHAAEDEFHDGGARPGRDGVGDGLEPDQEDCRDAAVERYHRVPQDAVVG